MQVHIRKGLQNQTVAEIRDLRIVIPFRQRFENAPDQAVLQHKVSVFHAVQFSQCRCGHKIPLEYVDRHVIFPHFQF